MAAARTHFFTLCKDFLEISIAESPDASIKRSTEQQQQFQAKRDEFDLIQRFQYIYIESTHLICLNIRIGRHDAPRTKT